MNGWTQLDHSLAQSLVASGVLSREALSALWTRGPQGPARHGSQLAEAIVRQGVLPPETVDGLLGSLAGTSLPARAQRVASSSGRQARASSASGRVMPAALARAFAGERYEPQGTANPWGVLPALDRRLQRTVAMHMGPAARSAEAESFLREARVLAQLDHPSLPKVHDMGALGGRAYYTLDHLEGRSLAKIGRARLPAQLRAFLTVAAGVEHAHGRGVVHGALRPEAVLLGAFGQVWITGWERAAALPRAPDGVRRAVSAPPPKASPLDSALLAPELSKEKGATPPTDVWGLGLVLHWILLGNLPGKGVEKGGAPRELLAIADKALSPVRGDRYPNVGALSEDVRRYLDHRRVEAADESLVQACRRLARAYPIPTASGAVVFLAVASLALAALVLRSRELERLRESVAEARAQQQAQEEKLAQAQVAQGSARAATERARRAQAFERSLLVAVTSTPTCEAEREVPPAFEATAELLDTSVGDERLRFHRSRGWWLMDHGRPDRALAEFTSALALRAQDEESALGSFLAAKRLPGAVHRKREEQALRALESCGESAALLVEATRLVEAFYVEAQAGADVEELASTALALLERLDYDPVDRVREVAHVALLQGIAHHCKAGLYTVATRIYPGFQVKDENRKHLGLGNAAMREAMRTDPAAVGPRVLMLRQHGIRWAYQATWRWESCSKLRHLQRVLELSQRPEALLEIAERLQVDQRAAESLPFVERFFASPPEALPGGRDLARAKVLRARAQLYAGLSPSLGDLQGLPAELDLDAGLLRGWTLLRRGEIAAGFAALKGAMRAPRHFFEIWRMHDFDAALADPRVDADALAELLAPVPRRFGPRGPDRLVLAAIHANARAGRSTPQEAKFLDQLALSPALPLRYARAVLARARTLPSAPGTHATALMIWASLNQEGFSNAREVRAARSLLLERLARTGREEAAASFAALRAIEDLWPPRANVPPLVRVTEEAPQ